MVDCGCGQLWVWLAVDVVRCLHGSLWEWLAVGIVGYGCGWLWEWLAVCLSGQRSSCFLSLFYIEVGKW